MTTNQPTYVIGEIGQNHNGSADIAKIIVDVAARPIREEVFGLELKSFDAVKLTKRDLAEELTDSAMSRPYNSPHSFGATYGQHRAALELTDEEHYEVYLHAKSYGLDFVETLCAIGCLSMLKLFTPDRLKIASRDLTNLPLLAALAETKIPIIASTGMASQRELDDGLNTIARYHSNITILHCVSEYPTKPQNLNLRTIIYLQKRYGQQYTIGYSDHSIGISVPLAAVAMGAAVIEKHITIDRRMKGTDQAGSLGPDGIYRMMRDLRMLDMSMGVEDIFICEDIAATSVKLERSIATKYAMRKGQILQEADLHLLSPGDGIKWRNKHLVIGRKLNTNMPANEIIYPDKLEG